ncbi:hypothetical protein BGW42_000470 [Actinomortierella wolfii]|nr:hypothetical protein BGW42_000470 [Actinomortierella wolfii]
MTALWEGMGTIWLFRKRSLTCYSDVEEATMVNSTICGIQGIMLVYLVGVLFIQGITLIANLHSLIVYRSSRVQNQVSKLIGLSFVLPVALVIAPAVKKQFGFSGYGSICFMISDLVNPYFFYPVGAMMVVGVLVHLATVLYMIKTYVTSGHDWSSASGSNSQPSTTNVSHPTASTASGSNSQLSKRQKRVQTARDISRLLKQQWRPGAFALCQIKKFERIQTTSGWFLDWSKCLGQQAIQNILQFAMASSGTSMTTSSLLEPTLLKQLSETAQRSCIAVAKDNVPQFWKLCLSDAAPAVFGICIFFIFGSKYELWQDWKRFFLEKVLRRDSLSNYDQGNAIKMVRRKGAGANKGSEGGDDNYMDNGRAIPKERKSSIPSVQPMNDQSINKGSSAPFHHDIAFYTRRSNSVSSAKNTINNSGSLVDLVTAGANFAMTVPEHKSDADDGYIPYYPPAAPAQSTAGDIYSAAAHKGNDSAKRSVSFQQTPTIMGGGLIMPSTSPSPAPYSQSTYGGPTARRIKKRDRHQQQRGGDDQKDLSFLPAYGHDEQQQQQQQNDHSGTQFYKDLDTIPESVPPPPQYPLAPSRTSSSSDIPYFDPTIYYAPNSPTPTPSTPSVSQLSERDRLREHQEARARNVLDGTEPWPSWPSSSTVAAVHADIAGLDPDPAVIVKGHRIRKQLSIILDHHPNSANAQADGPPVTARISEDGQGEQDKIRQRNQLHPSPLSTATPATIGTPRTILPASPKSPISPWSPPPPPFIPPRSKSRPPYSHK